MIDPGNSQKEKEMDEVATPEQQELRQEQEPQEIQTQENGDTTEPAATEENKAIVADDVTGAGNSPTPGKKRVKKVPQVTEAELQQHPSIWPILLAASVAIMLGGFAFNLIILGVGVVLVIVSTIGWNLERR
jgi:hypothetical protein